MATVAISGAPLDIAAEVAAMVNADNAAAGGSAFFVWQCARRRSVGDDAGTLSGYDRTRT